MEDFHEYGRMQAKSRATEGSKAIEELNEV